MRTSADRGEELKPQMDTNALTLLLIAALSRASARPFHVPDVQAYLRGVSDDRSTRPVVEATRGLQWFDASGIYAVLHDLEARGDLAREPRGYVLTQQGEDGAEALRASLASVESTALDRIAEQTAARAA